MKEQDFKEILKIRAKKLDVQLNEKQLDLLFKYKELILDWNKNINLTAIKDDEEFINKHFIDSLTIAKYIQNTDAKIIDIGTGAGFPGVPINIYLNSDMVLFDSLNKRLKVLDDIIQKLELSNIKTLHGRAEETFINKQYRETFDIATSRAVANLNVLAEYILPAVKIGGFCICMKAGNTEKEINEAKSAIDILGGKIEKIDKLIIPDTDIERTIIIIKKLKNTPNNYPRKPGTPAKDPIK